MSKKIISLFTLVTFIVFSISCITTYETRKISMAPDGLERSNLQILGVQTTSGKYIEFLRSLPIDIYQNSIKGYKREVVDQANVNNIIRKDGEIYKIETKDGKRLNFSYKKVLYSEKKEIEVKYFCEESISIPLSEVELVWIGNTVKVNKIDKKKAVTFALFAALVGGILFIMGQPGNSW